MFMLFRTAFLWISQRSIPDISLADFVNWRRNVRCLFPPRSCTRGTGNKVFDVFWHQVLSCCFQSRGLGGGRVKSGSLQDSEKSATRSYGSRVSEKYEI